MCEVLRWNTAINSAHEDMDTIIADIQEAHKKDITTADEGTVATKLNQDIEDAMQFRGSAQERQLRIYCNQLGIPYDKLTPEEFAGVLGALKKSNYIKNKAYHQRSKSPSHKKK